MNLVNTALPLPRAFYQSDTRDVARALLGKRLVRQLDDGIIEVLVVETEAYLTGDPASHTFRGRTKRNQPMFGIAGHTYVYLSYGVHDMLNIVTADHDIGEAVLIRAGLALEGIDLIRQNANKPDSPFHRLLAGPGLLAKALNISYVRDNNIDVTTTDGGLWIEDGINIAPESVVETTRIGLTKAPEKPWRFYIAGNPAVSRP